MIKFLNLVIVFTSIVISADLVNNNADKLVISPVELIDMVIKERMKNHAPTSRRALMHLATRFTSTTKNTGTENTTELNDDENTSLKRRKVWSRWGKWGECSVTCGGGVKTRQRLCAGGRCARGELEQQRRTCARAPCEASTPPPHDTE